MEILAHSLGLAVLGAGVLWGWRSGRPGRALALFAWVAAVATYPLVFSLDRLPANAPASNDAFLFLWDLWWVKSALLRGQNPLFCDVLFAPHGTTLVYHGLALPQALATLPLQATGEGLVGLVRAYDAVVWISFTLAGWGAYRLALALTGHEAGALVAGLAFTVQSLHFASTARFHALSIEWLPLVLWALLCVVRHGRPRDGLWLGLAFVVVFHASIEYAYFLLLAGGLLFLFEWAREPGRARELGFWWRCLPGLAAAALLTIPFWLAFAEESRLTHGSLADHARFLTPDVLDVLLPDPRHSLFGGAIGALRESLGLRPLPTAVATSWTLIALAGVGTVAALRARAVGWIGWVVIALAFGALTLGPTITVLGRETGIPSPWSLLTPALPFFEQARMPMRFGAVFQLALAMLAAHGLAVLAVRLGPRRGVALCVAAAAGVGFEALRVPLEMAPVRVPEAYARVAAASPPRSTALVEWPRGVGETAEIEGLHQIVHQQKLVQELPLFLPRVAEENLRTARGRDFTLLEQSLLVNDRLRAAEGEDRARRIATARARLARLGVAHVVLRRAELPPVVYERGREHLLLLGPSERFEDEDGFLASFLEPGAAAPRPR